MKKLWMYQRVATNHYRLPSAYLDLGEYRYGKVLRREIRRFGLTKFRREKLSVLGLGKSGSGRIIRQIPLLKCRVRHIEAEEGT